MQVGCAASCLSTAYWRGWVTAENPNAESTTVSGHGATVGDMAWIPTTPRLIPLTFKCWLAFLHYTHMEDWGLLHKKQSTTVEPQTHPSWHLDCRKHTRDIGPLSQRSSSPPISLTGKKCQDEIGKEMGDLKNKTPLQMSGIEYQTQIRGAAAQECLTYSKFHLVECRRIEIMMSPPIRRL